MDDNKTMEFFDLTPAPQLLQILGDLKFKGWQCVAELIDNSIDAIINSDHLPIENRKIIVSVPTPAKLNENVPLVIEDFADGMNEQTLQNAVRAGFSGKNTKDNIGLFGMGFNVATACLAHTVEVWSSTKSMEKEIGLQIDLREMANNRSFQRKKLERPKRHDKVSGTEIKIYDFKKDTESLLKVRDIVDNLNRAYTLRIFDEHNISIKVNQHDIKPFKFCTWSERVMLKVKHEDIPAFISIDEQLKQENFCENCFNWLGATADTTLKIECQYCHSNKHIVKKDIYIVGWLGIQRYPDPDHYGIDISRNGRILRKLDKSLFDWLDERVKDDFRFQPEYPRDNPLYNGRIVGQIEANFVVPKYTKDDFNTDDPNWKLAVKFLRGPMPLQTDLGEAFGFKGLNRSPIGNLFRAYRRIDPPGKKTLMFAKLDGSGKADPVRQKNWREKFYQGETDYVDEKKWIEEIDKAELKETPSTFNPLNPGSKKVLSPEEIRLTNLNNEKYPGKKFLRGAQRIDIDRLIGEKPFELTLYDYYPENDINIPIILESQGSIGKFNVYLNHNHPMLTDFADGYEDLLYIEVASRYALMKNMEEWTVTRIYYELKSKYSPGAMLSVSKLQEKASNLVVAIHKKLVLGGGIHLTRKPNLSDVEIKSITNKYLNLEKKNVPDINSFIMNTKFLEYLDLNYIFRFIEDFPELIYDGNILNLPYAILDSETKQNQLKRYSEFFNDLKWIINQLGQESPEAIKKLKQQIIRSRISIDILHDQINK